MGRNQFTKRVTITEQDIITATPFQKHLSFYREFKPLEVELISFLMEHSGENHSMSEIATVLGHPVGWGTNFRKAMLALEQRGYVVVTREHHYYHRYELSDKFRNMFTK
jgi:hypothetical protein